MTAEHVECRDLPGSQECVEKISPLHMVKQIWCVTACTLGACCEAAADHDGLFEEALAAPLAALAARRI